MPPALKKMESTLKSTAEADALTVKWGAHEIKGLDPKRAEAIGLQPVMATAVLVAELARLAASPR